MSALELVKRVVENDQLTTGTVYQSMCGVYDGPEIHHPGHQYLVCVKCRDRGRPRILCRRASKQASLQVNGGEQIFADGSRVGGEEGYRDARC